MVQPRSCSRSFFKPLALVFVSFALAGCSTEPDPKCPDGSDPPCVVPLPTELQVTTSTTGEDFDLSAYVLTIGEQKSLIGLDQAITLDTLDVGSYTVQLDDVAANCSVVGGTSRQAVVADGNTTEVSFAVTCTALPPATVDVTGTWTGKTIQGQEFDIEYVLEQTGDDVTASRVDFVKPPGCDENCAFLDTGVGRVSDSTFTLFVINLNEEGVLRLTTIHAVSGNQMAGSQTSQLCCFSATLAVTKQ